MEMKKLGMALALGMFVFAVAPAKADTLTPGTIWGGFDDAQVSVNAANGYDYDYQDMVFTLTGASITFEDSAAFVPFTGTLDSGGGVPFNSSNPPGGIPYWNNGSFDGGPVGNIGACMYGYATPGACGGNAPIAPGSDYLADSSGPNGSPTDVTFSTAAGVDGTLTEDFGISTGDSIGWECLTLTGCGTTTYGTVTWCGYGPNNFAPANPAGVTGIACDVPGGSTFAVAGCSSFFAVNPTNATGAPSSGTCNEPAGGTAESFTNWDGVSTGNAGDSLQSHFALFADVAPITTAPEPGTVGMLCLGLIGLGFLRRRNKALQR
jgi:hypothetical protein